jgi:tRNA A-37 threonylcarbamoyl transferase component Bud32
MYEYGSNYIVLDYVNGKTLYECLIEGIKIPEQAIIEVDNAIQLAKGKGLNPSDIHLKNIILTNAGIKVIDVARFLQEKECKQWEDLKKGVF